jgi:hypothetical protein
MNDEDILASGVSLKDGVGLGITWSYPPTEHRPGGLVEKVTVKRESAVRRDLFIAQSISKPAKLH